MARGVWDNDSDGNPIFAPFSGLSTMIAPGGELAALRIEGSPEDPVVPFTAMQVILTLAQIDDLIAALQSTRTGMTTATDAPEDMTKQ